jgi:hypothetical protein
MVHFGFELNPREPLSIATIIFSLVLSTWFGVATWAPIQNILFQKKTHTIAPDIDQMQQIKQLEKLQIQDRNPPGPWEGIDAHFISRFPR